MKMLRIIALLFFLLPGGHSTFAQPPGSAQQAANIEAFARLYGYVRYFHPSDEASKINWTDFLWYAIPEVQHAADHTELLKRLNRLFNPVAPAIRVFKTGDTFSPVNLVPADVQKFRVIAWQHLGYGDGKNPEYQSRRTNRAFSIPGNRPGKMISGYSKQLFERIPVIGEFAEKALGDGISCRIPLALYGNDSGTYPAADPAAFNVLQQTIDGAVTRVLQERTVTTTERLAAVIYSWNVLKHFYPYRTIIDSLWDEQLTQGIRKILNTTGQSLPIAGMTEKLVDGHIQLSVASVRISRTVPVKVSLAEEKLVITRVDTSLQANGISPGDLLLEINGKPALAMLDTIKKGISGTTQWKTYSALQKLFDGPDKTTVTVKIQSEETVRSVQLARTAPVDAFDLVGKPSGKPGEGIYYINLGNTSMKEIKKMLPGLVKARGIVCDLRGYPNNNEEFLRYLLTATDTSRNFYTPEIIYPDFERVTWQREGWALKPASPHLTAKVIFLADGRSISYAESYLAMVKSYQLGTIIGQPTAGANGDLNSLTIPVTNILIPFTGLIAMQPDGSPLQGIGIKPDIMFSPTIRAIKEGRDELLEKALEMLR